ncbi:acyltransferase [Acidobacteriota bacterium]
MNQVVDPSLVRLGADTIIDEFVILGYKSPRELSSHRLVIGEGSKVRAGSIIYGGSTIGMGLETGHNVVIREENIIGDNLRIWANSVIDYGCKLGNNVTIHCNCYVAQFTEIHDGVFLAPGVTIANDYHPGCVHSRECMRGPVIGAGVRIGVNVTIVPYVKIGERCLVGSGAVITKSLPPDSVAYGNPARVVCQTKDLRCKTGITDQPYPEG